MLQKLLVSRPEGLPQPVQELILETATSISTAIDAMTRLAMQREQLFASHVVRRSAPGFVSGYRRGHQRQKAPQAAHRCRFP